MCASNNSLNSYTEQHPPHTESPPGQGSPTRRCQNTRRGAGEQCYSFTPKGISRDRSLRLRSMLKMNKQAQSPGKAHTTEYDAASNYTQIRRLISQQSSCQQIKPLKPWWLFNLTGLKISPSLSLSFHILYKGKNPAALQALIALPCRQHFVSVHLVARS